MRKTLAIVVMAVALTSMAYADLQNVQVGGGIRIRGDWWNSGNDTNTWAAVTQRTRLNVRADFTDTVSAFIELDANNVWGDSFRSNYLTGVDNKGVANAQLYQAYIEAGEMFGTPLRARVGRQELKLGSGWLVGTNDKAPFFTGLSFDALRLTYKTDQFSVDAFAAKLAEKSPAFEDADQDLYGVYASYLGIENVTLDAYWLYIRDGGAMFDTGYVDADDEAILQQSELDVHTFGLRGAGTLGALDFEAEAAFQLIEGADDDIEIGGDVITINDISSQAWAGHAEVGYTFDMNYTPRVFLGGAAFEGADDGDLAFDRLFSDWKYSQFWGIGLPHELGSLNFDEGGDANMTNFWVVRAGASAVPVENVKVQLSAAYLSLINGLDRYDADGNVDAEDATEIGWELSANVVYNYTQDLSIEAGYAHLFSGDAMDTQNLDDLSEIGSDDADYFYVQTKLAF